MIPIIEKALLLANKLDEASRKQPVYFRFKDHTFMTEGTQTYALCYDTKKMQMAFVKCEIKEGKIKFIDKEKQIPTEKLKNYPHYLRADPQLGKRFFKISTNA